MTGQTDSLSKKYMDYDNSKSEVISKWRRVLLDKFMEGDLKAVREIKNHLVYEVENENYAVFYPAEYWLILYWTQEYNYLTNSVLNYDSLQISSFRQKIKPQQDYLAGELLRKTRESLQMNEFYIRLSGISAIDKDFLSMNLRYIVSGDDFAGITQDSLNTLADAFLKKYPKSDYENFIRKNIRFKYKPAKWGFGVEFFSGYGIFSNDIAKSFTNTIPVGVAFDIYFINFVLYLRDFIGFSQTRKDIAYDNGVWEKGSQVRVYLPEASLGYVVFNNRYLKIAPFAGIASMSIGPTEHDTKEEPDLKKANLTFTTTYAAGLNLDIKPGEWKKSKPKYRQNQDYWFVRVRYALTLPQFDWKYDDYNGVMNYITIGVGIFTRKNKRDY
jgi:hypothetical protein